MAIFAPWITQFDPTLTNSRVSLAAPGGAHPLGADFMGRDMWSRIVYGARISLAVGHRLDRARLPVRRHHRADLGLFRRLVRPHRAALHGRDAVAAAAGDGAGDDRGARAVAQNTIIAISIPLVPTVARVIRSNTLMLREMPYVEAARAVGMNEFSIALRHVLPNTLAPLIVLATAQLGSTILVEAALSFLGLGVPEPHPSWGRMLSELAAEYVRVAPWLVIFPGARDLAGGVRHQSAGRCAARHPRSAAARLMLQTQADTEPTSARCRGSAHLFLPARRHPEGGRRRELSAEAARDAGDRRRIRLRQVDDRALADAADPRPPGKIVGGVGEARRTRPDRARRAAMRARARQRHLDDLPGADDVAQSGDDRRQPDRRGAAAAREHVARGRAASARSRSCAWCASPSRSSG